MMTTNARVAVVTAYYRPIVGGVESNAERLALYLKNAGHAVRVITKRIDRALPDRATLAGIEVERIGPSGPRSAAGKWQVMPFLAAWLVRHAASYDVVCCIDYRGVALGVLAARAWTRRPAVVQAQTSGVLSGDNIDGVLRRWGFADTGALARLVKWPIRATYGRADAFACISREIEREALRCGIGRDRVHYLPNAIDMTAFAPAADSDRADLRRRFDVPPGMVACLFLGRLSREKGLMDLLEAWRLRRPDHAVLLVAGPDMDDHPWNVGPAARAFVKAHDLDASVRFLGSMTDVAPLLRAGDLLVQPSHFEALGLSAIEALACGVPVIACGVGGLLGFVVDGENGLLCPPQDPQALAAALGALIEDAPLRQRLASQARSSVAAYDERLVFARFAALLNHLSVNHAAVSYPPETAA
jgi:glycosyltransferase involved in cell wall biosynthesis